MKIEQLIKELETIANCHPGIDVVKTGTNPDYGQDNHWELDPMVVSVELTDSCKTNTNNLPCGAKYVGGFCPVTGEKTNDGSVFVVAL